MRRVEFILAGAVVSAIVGPVLGTALLSLSWTEHLKDVPYSLALVPMMLPVALFVASPFGFMGGLAGSWWLTVRAPHTQTKRRLYFEMIGAGAVLGVTYPVVGELLDVQRPRIDRIFLTAILVGAACGCMLAFLFLRWMQQTNLPLTSPLVSKID